MDKKPLCVGCGCDVLKYGKLYSTVGPELWMDPYYICPKCLKALKNRNVKWIQDRKLEEVKP